MFSCTRPPSPSAAGRAVSAPLSASLWYAVLRCPPWLPARLLRLPAGAASERELGGPLPGAAAAVPLAMLSLLSCRCGRGPRAVSGRAAAASCRLLLLPPFALPARRLLLLLILREGQLGGTQKAGPPQWVCMAASRCALVCRHSSSEVVPWKENRTSAQGRVA